MQEANTNYDTDLFSPVINVLMKFTKKYKYDPNAYFSNDEKQRIPDDDEFENFMLKSTMYKVDILRIVTKEIEKQ